MEASSLAEEITRKLDLVLVHVHYQLSRHRGDELTNLVPQLLLLVVQEMIEHLPFFPVIFIKQAQPQCDPTKDTAQCLTFRSGGFDGLDPKIVDVIGTAQCLTFRSGGEACSNETHMASSQWRIKRQKWSKMMLQLRC
jgi:hypothetical protein